MNNSQRLLPSATPLAAHHTCVSSLLPYTLEL